MNTGISVVFKKGYSICNNTEQIDNKIIITELQCFTIPIKLCTIMH